MKQERVVMWLEIGVAFVASLGSALAYTEAKFAPKESTQRDLSRIESKIDNIYQLLINGK